MRALLKPVKYLIGLTIKTLHLPVNIGGLKIQFPSFMNASERGSTITGKYEISERKLVSKYIKSDDAVLEMGACIGVVSLSINKMLKDKTKQVSVEPNPQMHKYLRENKKNNKGEFNIETCIVSKQKEVDFFIGGKAFLGSNTMGRGKKVTVPGKTLTELTNEYFDFTALVMDIEGGELNFFRSFDLESSKIRLIIWETHMHPNMLSKEELFECYDRLEKQGFSLNEKVGNVEAWSRNV